MITMHYTDETLNKMPKWYLDEYLRLAYAPDICKYYGDELEGV
jgi:hypothetical protein